MDQQPDERYELYQRFRQELASQSSADMFYDEKELVEIFDIAGDYDDDYVRTEALLLGYRLYPDSEDLYVRRSYLYYDMGIDEGVSRMLVSRPRNADVLWELMRLRTLKNIEQSDVSAKLSHLLETHDLFDDEELIQLVDCASSLGAYSWLKENMSQLRKKCSYLPTLLYEMQVVASTNQDQSTAISMLEELTGIEPFNAEFWCLLADEQLKAGNAEDAEVSADYAMAIDPDDYRPKLCKAKALLLMSRGFDSVIDMLQPLAAQHLDDLLYVQALAVAYINTSQVEQAERLLLGYNADHPDEKTVVDYLLLIHHHNHYEMLNRFFSHSPQLTEADWVEWAQSHRASGQYVEAALILNCYERNSGIRERRSLYYGTLYEARLYTFLADELARYMDAGQHEILPELAVTGVLSLLRLDHRSEALAYARTLIDRYRGGGVWSVNRALATIGTVTSLAMIVKALEEDPKTDIDLIDPFMPPAVREG